MCSEAPLFLARTKADPLTVSPPAKMFRLPGAAAIPDAHVSNDCPAARRLQVPGPDDLHLAIVEGRNAFMALETAWNDLHRRAGQPHQVFLSFNWMWHWCAHFHDEAAERIVLLMGRRAGRLVMLWPMVRRRRFGVASLQWMGAPVTPYGDALIETGLHTQTDLAAAWDYLRHNARAHAIELGNVRADAAVAGLLAFEQPKITRQERACSLDLAALGSWNSFEAAQSAKARKNRRRQRRRLEEMGVVRFEMTAEGARARELTLEALALKRRWLEAKGLASSAFATKGFDEFFAAVASSRDRPAGCRVASLEMGGKAVAVAVAFVHKGHVAVHVIAYDPDVEACAPGSLLFEDMIRDAFSKGWRCFDLMWPGNAYKAEWAPTETAVTSCAAPVTSLGLIRTEIAPRVRSALKAAHGAMGPTTRKLAIRMLGH